MWFKWLLALYFLFSVYCGVECWRAGFGTKAFASVYIAVNAALLAGTLYYWGA